MANMVRFTSNKQLFPIRSLKVIAVTTASYETKSNPSLIIENHFLIYLHDADVSDVRLPISPNLKIPVLVKIQKLVSHFVNRLILETVEMHLVEVRVIVEINLKEVIFATKKQTI